MLCHPVRTGLPLSAGILSIGLAAAYYSAGKGTCPAMARCLSGPAPHRCLLSTDSLGWKLFYVSGCLLVAVQNLEDWEVRLGRVGAGGNIPDGLPWAPLLRGPPPGSAS